MVFLLVLKSICSNSSIVKNVKKRKKRNVNFNINNYFDQLFRTSDKDDKEEDRGSIPLLNDSKENISVCIHFVCIHFHVH